MAAGNAVTIILLAGGEARRLPGKLSMQFRGEPLLVRTFKRLMADGRRPCVISVRTELSADLRAAMNVPMVPDHYGQRGPLGGLLSAAETLQTPLFFAAAGDLPFLHAAFIARLEKYYDGLIARTAGHPIAVLPRRSDGKVEPLAALYDTAAFLSGAAAALRRGETKVTAALAGRSVAYFDLEQADEHDLANVNTAEDWQRLQA